MLNSLLPNLFITQQTVLSFNKIHIQLLLINVVFRRNTTVLVPNNLNLKH